MKLMLRVGTLLLMSSVGAASAWAFSPFTVQDVEVRGLERISLGTVLNYLPLSVGEQLDEARADNVIKELFKTGFFDDVSVASRGDVLVIVVKERPAIASIDIAGNQDIETEALNAALAQIGLTSGRVFDRSALDKVVRELERQYINQGQYGVKIESQVVVLDDGRVEIDIDINEGDAATIKQINLVGNHAYSDDILRNKFQLDSPGIFSGGEQYSRFKLGADLESLRSYYLDRGYINFNIDSTQVTLSPDKQDMFISINISEEHQYFINEIKLAGDLVLPEAELMQLVGLAEGDVFSRSQVTAATEALNSRLGEEGFAFANINAIPEVDKENHLISLTFFVDPGRRVYVRRINISGNKGTKDEVVRREFRQMEGGWISTAQIDRSRVRVQRLGFFENINIETPSVPGVANQVDVSLSLDERSSGSLTAGIGFSQTQGMLINASISQDNFMGSGKRITANINNSDVNTVYSFSYNNPYYTVDGISRGFNLSFRETDATEANIASYTSDQYGVGVKYGFPLSEFNRASLGIAYENTSIHTSVLTPQSVLDFLSENSDEFNIYKLTLGWSHDTRNRTIFANDGLLVSLSNTISLPGSGLEYYKIDARVMKFQPITKTFTLLMKGSIGYGDSYSDTTRLPFFEHYYAGGSSSVRGFEGNSLGPQENNVSQGGTLKVVANLELIVPMPFADKDNRSLRLSGFYDIGNVFATSNDYDSAELRTSAGIALIWMSPIAPLTFSYAFPLNDKQGDELERFQFTLGSFFF
ncbi:MAG: outer membrane protein assembly factor BamA [Thiotrichaceae bacterium]|nr:outer membrane protein assembly factor BamA [Thiotrichaceae bacterium]